MISFSASTISSFVFALMRSTIDLPKSEANSFALLFDNAGIAILATAAFAAAILE
ncbi:hypothetical protein D3C87_1897120 [compost metagenome]